MASMDGHFRSPYRMEIVCNPLSFRGTSFQYSVIQLYLFLVEICNPNLNFGWMRYVIMHRHKYFCYYLFNILKRDLPKRTGPFHYIGELIYSSTAACAAANFEANMLIINDLRLDWSTFGLQFSCILHVLHVDVS